MTVIVWDGETLAADRMASDDSSMIRTRKVYRLKNGEIAGVCGDMALCMGLIDWLNGTRLEINFPAALRAEERGEDSYMAALVIDKKGKAWIYENGPYRYPVRDKRIALGSGANFALMAMELGCEAHEAVRLTAKYCPSVGLGIDTITL